MSGGVDSSVAAALLQQQGYQVEGLFIDNGQSHAPSPDGPPHVHARTVADLLKINLTVVDAAAAFEQLKRLFAAEYAAGRTPNPCAICNRTTKFRALLDHAVAVGADHVATGHYARVLFYHNRPAIARGKYRPKDQSYFLFNVEADLPDRLLLPIGPFRKDEVRLLARQLNLPVHDKEDSLEICFIPDDDYARLVREFCPKAFEPGPVLHVDGRVLGAHEGIGHYTIGQRRGLKIALGEPAYVAAIDPGTRTVYLGPIESVRHRGLLAKNLNWLTDAPSGPQRCFGQIRSGHKAAPCTASIDQQNVLHVLFDEPQNAITPGQAVALYDDDILLGGGWIDRQVH